MRLRAVCFAVVLAASTAAVTHATQTSPPPAEPSPPRAAAPGAGPGAPDTSAPDPAASADVDRIKRRLGADTPLLDAGLTTEVPTFRASVTEKIDIWKYWGERDAVAAYVRPNGGTWHQEFQRMVTPDEFKGYGGILTNGEKLQLAMTSLAVSGALKLLGIGVQHLKDAAQDRNVSEAKAEVSRELEAFYDLHPEARPHTPLSPP